ncbi:MAG: thiamine phosphate synthase [Lachnospiraceae bacterium]|nr:thiamine phosphate synthase [Lachnospiraceae bacterium]
MSDIICVTNRKLCREDFLTRIERIAAAGVAGIILREKDMDPIEYERLAEQVIKMCENYPTKCILHSFTDVALRLNHRAIHLPLGVLGALNDEQRMCFDTLGASCHSAEDAAFASDKGCTYIVAGHVYDTDCKRGLPGRGPGFLQEVSASVSIPVYGIGGIGPQNIGEVRACHAGACLMSSLMTTPDVEGLIKAMEVNREI